MRLEEVWNLKNLARKELQSSILPGFIGDALEKARELTVTLGVGWLPGSQGGPEDYWLTARIRTKPQLLLVEKRVRATLQKLAGDNFDLRYTGPVRALQQVVPNVPAAAPQLTIGSSVSHIQTLGGTLGFFARSTKDDDQGTRGFVSANHVIANLGRPVDSKFVVSPAQSQGRIGELVRFTSLDPKEGKEEKRTDAAFAKLNPSVSVDRSSLPQGKTLLKPAAVASETTRVMKLGMASNFTIGKVTSFDQDTFSTRYADFGKVKFDDQIEVESTDPAGPFATSGDSGSLVFDDTGHALGLLFAATDAGLAYVNPIQFVLKELEVEIDVDP